MHDRSDRNAPPFESKAELIDYLTSHHRRPQAISVDAIDRLRNTNTSLWVDPAPKPKQ